MELSPIPHNSHLKYFTKICTDTNKISYDTEEKKLCTFLDRLNCLVIQQLIMSFGQKYKNK